MANTKITSKVIADANILTAAIADNAVTGDKVADDVALAGNPTTTTQTAGNSTTRLATTAFVSTAISNLVDSSPAALNTLNELAAALGDNANFSTTVTDSIATKLPLAGGTMTGNLVIAFDSNNSGNRLRIADTEGASAAERTYSTSDGTGLILNHYYALSGSPYVRYSDFVSSMGDGAATNMRFLTKPHNGNPTVALTIDQSQKATFTGTIEIPTYIIHAGDSNTYFGFNATDNFELFTGGSDRMSIVGSETVFNDGSEDKDFRVESNDSANMLLVNGGDNNVSIIANNTDSVTNSATALAARTLIINGNEGEGSDNLSFFAMADGTGNYGMEVSNSAHTAQYDLLINPIKGGNVGIGVTSANTLLHAAKGSNGSGLIDVARFQNTGTTVNDGARIQLTAGASTSGAGIGCLGDSLNSAHLVLHSGGNNERVRLSSNGTLSVNNTNTAWIDSNDKFITNGRGVFRGFGHSALAIGRYNSGASNGEEGSLLDFLYGGSGVGSIDILSSNIVVKSVANLHFQQNGNSVTRSINFTGTSFKPFDSNDNTMSMGTSGARWTQLFAATSTIGTSDRNEKQNEAAISAAEKRVAIAAKGLLKKFKFKDAVTEKGSDARIHFGIIAQDLQDAFSAEGLDASDYAMWCSDTWTDEDTGQSKTRLGIRYEELLAFIIAGM